MLLQLPSSTFRVGSMASFRRHYAHNIRPPSSSASVSSSGWGSHSHLCLNLEFREVDAQKPARVLASIALSNPDSNEDGRDLNEVEHRVPVQQGPQRPMLMLSKLAVLGKPGSQVATREECRAVAQQVPKIRPVPIPPCNWRLTVDQSLVRCFKRRS